MENEKGKFLTFFLQFVDRFFHKKDFLIILDMADPVDQFAQLLVEVGVPVLFLGDLFTGVQDGGVVLAAEDVSNLRGGGVRQGPAEIHGHLSGESHVLAPLLGEQVFRGNIEVGSGDVLDQFQRDLLLAFRRIAAAHGAAGQVHGDALMVEGGLGLDAGQRAFQLADVAVDAAGDEIEHIIGDFQIVRQRLLLKNGEQNTLWKELTMYWFVL